MRVDLVLGMSGRLAIIMSIPWGKLIEIPRCDMRSVLVGSKVSHLCKA